MLTGTILTRMEGFTAMAATADTMIPATGMDATTGEKGKPYIAFSYTMACTHYSKMMIEEVGVVSPLLLKPLFEQRCIQWFISNRYCL